MTFELKKNSVEDLFCLKKFKQTIIRTDENKKKVFTRRSSRRTYYEWKCKRTWRRSPEQGPQK